MIGAVLCLLVMFVSAWHFALLAITIGLAVYKYIEYAGAKKEWGDGLKGKIYTIPDSGSSHN